MFKRIGYKREGKTIMQKCKKYIIIALILEGVLIFQNPIIVYTQSQAIGRYFKARGDRNTYNWIKATKGETIANIWSSSQTWKDTFGSFNKAWVDTLSMFR